MDNNDRIINNVIDSNNIPEILPLSSKHIKDLTNMIFGKLKVLGYIGNAKNKNKSLWLCQCQCKNKTLKIVTGSHLTEKYKPTRSCGCLIEEKRIETQTTHGMTGNRLYRIWRGMMNRCYNKKDESYKHYGGRGIIICDEWLTKNSGFTNFYNWAINNGYKNNLTIERIDVNQNYEPSNSTWILMEKQAQNTRKNIRVIYNGIEYTLSKLYDLLKPNMRYDCLRQRILNGLDIHTALIKPLRITSKNISNLN